MIIKVLGRRVQIKMDEITDYGRLSADGKTITINQDLQDDDLLDTLLHELLHVIFSVLGIDLEEEEALVHQLAAVLSAVLIDNPELREWVEELADSKKWF
jgi:Zn-dependent peptidase ImmA (M78 family)